MKRMVSLAITSLLLSPLAFAIPPVTLSGPTPAILQSYSANTSSTVIYTIKNNVPKNLPVRIGGISNGIKRTHVENDCGKSMPAGPSTCNIGIAISPSAAQIGSSISQILQVNYEGRTPLTSPISFSVIQPFAYVTSIPTSSPDIINQFSLDVATGLFSSNSTAYSSTSQNFEQLTFATVAGVQYAYVVDQNGFVYKCTLNNADGTFNTCSGTPLNPPSWNPHGIAFATVDGVQYAYITDVNEDVVYQCFLGLDGSFKSCLAQNNFFFAPYGIAFATVDGVQYAYVADAGPGSGFPGYMNRCTLNPNGSFNACTTTPQQNTPVWVPYAITFTTVSGKQYAYVADNGTGINPGNVYQCTLNKQGFFNTCTATPSNSPTTNWVPSYIAFATLDGKQYAYVANYQGPTLGGMYRCTLNQDGSLNDCDATPATPPISGWQPVGVAFRFN